MEGLSFNTQSSTVCFPVSVARIRRFPSSSKALQVIPKHCVLSSVQTQPYLHRRFFPGMHVDGLLKYFSASVRRNWHWTAIRYALHRESKGTGCLCHWHISCVQWVLVGSARLKLDITKSVIPFSWKSIVIFFNAQRKVMILIHL